MARITISAVPVLAQVFTEFLLLRFVCCLHGLCTVASLERFLLLEAFWHTEKGENTPYAEFPVPGNPQKAC